MATLRFYIDKKIRRRSKKNSVYLVICQSGKRIYYYPGIVIPPDSWDQSTERIKKNSREARHINPILDILENKFFEIEGKLKLDAFVNGKAKPDLEEIQKAFLESVKPIPKPKKISKPKKKAPPTPKTQEPNKLLIHLLFKKFIREKSSTYKEGTLRVFRRVMKNLKAFGEQSKESLEVENIDLKFQRAYVNYLVEEMKYSNATIATEIKKIHAILSHYEEDHNNRAYRKFKAPKFESKRFICNYQEVLDLYNYEPQYTSHLKVRDCVVFSFFTGLAFSDICNLRHSNLLDDTLNGEPIKIIDFKRQKTKKYNQIPLNSICVEIIERWNGQQAGLLPIYQNDQTVNKYLHELLRDSGLFDKEVQQVRESGNKRIVNYLPRWQAITFHSFRHGYASYLASQDVNPITIQKLMGHSDLKTTMIYIQQNRKQVFAEALDKLEK